MSKRLGSMACLCCGEEIPVKESATGTINASCPWCDFPAYAKAGTQAHSIISKRLKPAAEPVPASQAGLVNKDKPAPEKKEGSMWEILGGG